jgi:hypothetical protein
VVFYSLEESVVLPIHKRAVMERWHRVQE